MAGRDEDLARYVSDMRVIASHIGAARQAAVGVFLSNPLSHGMPPLDDIPDRLDKMFIEVMLAAEAGKKALAEKP